jgi:hypothetical protein
MSLAHDGICIRSVFHNALTRDQKRHLAVILKMIQTAQETCWQVIENPGVFSLCHTGVTTREFGGSKQQKKTK